MVSVVLATLVAAHLAYAAVAAAFTAAFEEHRLINIRNFPDSDWDAITRAFILSQQKQGNIRGIVVGSSFSWGYSWHEETIFTNYLNKGTLPKKGRFLNLSMIGGRTREQIEVLRAAADAGLSTDIVIFEINPSNLANDFDPSRPVRNRATSHRNMPILPPYMQFYFLHFYGLEFVPIVYNQYNYAQPETDLRFGKLPDDYFLMPGEVEANRTVVEEIVSEVSHLGARIAPRVVIFFSPHQLNAVDELDMDAAGVRSAIERLLAICQRQAGVECLDTMTFQDRRLFRDVTHLNQRGHKAFANFLERTLGL